MVKEVFNSKEELKECLKWWQDKLFLTDWIIDVRISEPCDFITEDSTGEAKTDIVNKCCVIRILDPKYYGNRIIKYCAERVLVHELLHVKFDWFTDEGKYADKVKHGLLEQMAKSLIMAKYDLSYDYFDNREAE